MNQFYTKLALATLPHNYSKLSPMLGSEGTYLGCTQDGRPHSDLLFRARELPSGPEKVHVFTSLHSAQQYGVNAINILWHTFREIEPTTALAKEFDMKCKQNNSA